MQKYKHTAMAFIPYKGSNFRSVASGRWAPSTDFAQKLTFSKLIAHQTACTLQGGICLQKHQLYSHICPSYIAIHAALRCQSWRPTTCIVIPLIRDVD